MRVCISAMLTLLFSALPASPARSATIDVPNGSFESPEVAYAASDISDWNKAPVPDWWALTGALDEQWTNAGGVFLNTPNAWIDNLEGNQAAFMFALPGYELFQDLAATYTVGQSYSLTVGIEGGGTPMELGVPMEIRLFYRDAGDNRVTIDATEITNDNDTGVLSHLTDYHVDIPTVSAADPWAGKSIGVQLISTAPPTQFPGYWDIDNVRLVSTVPEPGCLALLAIGLGLLVARKWRTLKG
jgi:hypothetical protein